MFAKILVGHDLQDGGDDALALGRLIADACEARLVVAGVFPIGDLPHGFESEWREEEAKIAARIQAVADAAGAEAEAFPSSSPARGLHDLAAEIDCDLVVVGSSRHSKLGQVLAGNVGRGLLHGAPCAVGLAPKEFRKREPPIEAVAAGFDGSAESRAALEQAAGLAGALQLPLRVIGVAVPPPFAYGPAGAMSGAWDELMEKIVAELRAALDAEIAALPNELSAEAVLVRGDAAACLAAAAAAADALLVVGSRGYGPVRRVLLGSVSSELLGGSSFPLIVQPRPEAA